MYRGHRLRDCLFDTTAMSSSYAKCPLKNVSCRLEYHREIRNFRRGESRHPQARSHGDFTLKFSIKTLLYHRIINENHSEKK
jgi:hypothetical protein